jgi:glycosyltransferase involved in cell wall biosynthesis
VTIGGIRNERLPYYKFLFEKWAHNSLNNASIFNNYSAKDKFIKRGFRADKIFVIHNAIEIPKPSMSAKNERSNIRVVTVSRFVEQKDFRTALKSFKKLLDKTSGKSIHYYILGYGPLETDINSFAVNLNIKDKIKILINPKDIPEILKDCDIYLSTSLFEGLSNSIMEAMVAGLPVVATDVGDNRYLIEEGSNGYLVPCKAIDMIADRLKLLAESEETRKKFGEFSQIRIREEFSQRNLIENYLKVISEFQ